MLMVLKEKHEWNKILNKIIPWNIENTLKKTKKYNWIILRKIFQHDRKHNEIFGY